MQDTPPSLPSLSSSLPSSAASDTASHDARPGRSAPCIDYDWWAKHAHMLDKQLRVKPRFEGML
jgi:hypothetical protein